MCVTNFQDIKKSILYISDYEVKLRRVELFVKLYLRDVTVCTVHTAHTSKHTTS